MNKPTHYETLGVSRTSTPQEIKSAYRKIVLEHHPDRSKSVQSKGIFQAATDAYAVLSDEKKRNAYNITLDLMAPPKPTAKPAAKPEPEVPKASTIPQQLAQLQIMFNRGQVADAEKKAWEILDQSGREAQPYAILAEISRSRGQIHEAAQFYAYAAQFDPRTPEYQARYEQLLSSSRVTEGRRQNLILESQEQNLIALASGAFVVLCCVIYVTLAKENPAFASLAPISSWTITLISMLFVGGLAIGASLAIGKFLDAFQTITIGRSGQIWLFSGLSLVCFWFGVIAYVGLGFAQRAFSISLTRMFAGVSGTLMLMTIGAVFSQKLAYSQVFFFGGNVVFLGALTGWIGADMVRNR